MKILNVRNVNEALPHALQILEREGVKRDSRNGPVYQYPIPVTTVYQKPLENVLFSPDRDANPFFHLYEALWMLQGRNDVEPLVRYVKTSTDFSDDGKTLHGAYGHRWRKWFRRDQLEIIARSLKTHPEDRRCILQMWDTTEDLGRVGKDVPCNTIATFQRGLQGELNLVVFNRSNDIIWGCYGANAVQFSFLLEYMATWIGCPVGTYTQVSVNWHAYDNHVWKQVLSVRPDKSGYVHDPYRLGHASHISMPESIAIIDTDVAHILKMADTGTWLPMTFSGSWTQMIYIVLRSHHIFKTLEAPDKYEISYNVLDTMPGNVDWAIAAKDWILRRHRAWQSKQNLMKGDLSHP